MNKDKMCVYRKVSTDQQKRETKREEKKKNETKTDGDGLLMRGRAMMKTETNSK